MSDKIMRVVRLNEVGQPCVIIDCSTYVPHVSPSFAPVGQQVKVKVNKKLGRATVHWTNSEGQDTWEPFIKES